MPQAVVFDLYETLITEYVEGWAPQPSLAQCLGLAETEFTAGWQAHQADRMCGVQADFVAVLRTICQDVGHPVDDDLLYRLYAERLATKARPFGCPDSAIVQMPRNLHDRRVALGVISNCTPEEVTAWKTCALAEYVDAVVFSYEVGCAKPAPWIYQIACQRLGVSPQQTIFIGDGGSDELAGAARVGLVPYWATWFLDRWPAWKRAGRQQDGVRYPRLHRPSDVMAVVQESRCRNQK